MVDLEDLRELDKISLKEDLQKMSVEDIMADAHCGRELAEVLYDSIHGLNMTEPIPADEFIKELRSELL